MCPAVRQQRAPRVSDLSLLPKQRLSFCPSLYFTAALLIYPARGWCQLCPVSPSLTSTTPSTVSPSRESIILALSNKPLLHSQRSDVTLPETLTIELLNKYLYDCSIVQSKLPYVDFFLQSLPCLPVYQLITFASLLPPSQHHPIPPLFSCPPSSSPPANFVSLFFLFSHLLQSLCPDFIPDPLPIPLSPLANTSPMSSPPPPPPHS